MLYYPFKILFKKMEYSSECWFKLPIMTQKEKSCILLEKVPKKFIEKLDKILPTMNNYTPLMAEAMEEGHGGSLAIIFTVGKLTISSAKLANSSILLSLFFFKFDSRPFNTRRLALPRPWHHSALSYE